MPTLQEHVRRAKRNILFLANTNEKVEDCVDWQITAAFYVALHVIHAHLAKFGMHPNSHVDVLTVINPERQLSLAKLPPLIFKHYRALYVLSRRSRYMSAGENNKGVTKALFCSEKHLSKAVRHLDALLLFFDKHYEGGFDFDSIDFKCDRLKNNLEANLTYFKLM